MALTIADSTLKVRLSFTSPLFPAPRAGADSGLDAMVRKAREVAESYAHTNAAHYTAWMALSRGLADASAGLRERVWGKGTRAGHAPADAPELDASGPQLAGCAVVMTGPGRGLVLGVETTEAGAWEEAVLGALKRRRALMAEGAVVMPATDGAVAAWRAGGAVVLAPDGKHVLEPHVLGAHEPELAHGEASHEPAPKLAGPPVAIVAKDRVGPFVAGIGRDVDAAWLDAEDRGLRSRKRGRVVAATPGALDAWQRGDLEAVCGARDGLVRLANEPELAQLAAPAGEASPEPAPVAIVTSAGLGAGRVLAVADVEDAAWTIAHNGTGLNRGDARRAMKDAGAKVVPATANALEWWRTARCAVVYLAPDGKSVRCAEDDRADEQARAKLQGEPRSARRRRA